MKLHIAVLDDNQSVIELIRGTIENGFKSFDVEVEVETFSTFTKLENRMKEATFNIYFLDIKMPDIDGVEFGKRLKDKNPQTDIVFISSREERVFDAVQTQPFGFVRKSNFLNDISEVIERYMKTIKSTPINNTICLTCRGEKVNFSVNNIAYFEGGGYYQIVHFIDNDKECVDISSKMEILEKELAPYGFLRVHKGFLVNFFSIKSFEGNTIILKNNETIPISRRKSVTIREEFMELCKKYNVLTF